MARARNIKPGIMSNDELAALPPLTRLLFTYLWMLADREGRLEDKPKRIGAQALPYDDADVDAMLDDLHRAGFIRRYVADGLACIQILAFAKHQNPHSRESASELPPYIVTGIAKAVPMHNLGSDNASPETEPARLIPDSLIPDSPSRIPDCLAPAAGAEAPSPKRGSRLPADWSLPADYREWALSEYPQWTLEKVRLEAAKFRDHFVPLTGKAGVKGDWLATWRNWCRNFLAHQDDARLDDPKRQAGREDATERLDRDAARQTTVAPPDLLNAVRGIVAAARTNSGDTEAANATH